MLLKVVVAAMIKYISRLLYWRDASLNTFDYCIGGMHLSIHLTIVLEGCIPQYI